MDLIVSIILLVSISLYKYTNGESGTIISSTVVNEIGEIETVSVKESSLVVGKNLMLKREPRAFHKILDEMGLGR